MKKLFLLSLMAMLLPFAAWAQGTDISSADVDFDPATYQGTNTKAPQEYVTLDSKELTKGTDYTVAYYKNEEHTETVRFSTAGAGTYYVVITGQGEYSGTVETSFEIKKAELSIFAANTTKVYGTPDSEVEDVNWGVQSGLQPGDTKEGVEIENLAFERVANGEDVGEYGIRLKQSGTNKNYNITVVQTITAYLTITPATLKVKFDGLNWTYGETEAKYDDVTVTGDGYVFETDTDTSVGLTWKLVNEETSVHNAGTYPVVATITSDNYTLDEELAKANIEVAKKALTISFDGSDVELSSVYGTEPVDVTDKASIVGLQYDETPASIGLMLKRNGNKADGVNEVRGVRAYNTKTGSQVQYSPLDNYTTPTGNIVKWEIKAKELDSEDIVVAVKDLTYQGVTFVPEVTVTYVVDDETVFETLAATTSYTLNANAEEKKNAGDSFTVIITAVDGSNYTGTVTKTFTITKAPLTLTAGAQEFNRDVRKTVEEQFATLTNTVTITEGELKGDDTAQASNLINAFGITFNLSEQAAVGTIGAYDKGIEFTVNDELDFVKNYEVTTEAGKLEIKMGSSGITIGRGTANTATVLTAYNGQAVTATLSDDRTLKANRWYTMVLPFDITVRDFSNKLGYAVVDIANENNDKPRVLSFKLHMGTIPANTPFVFKLDQDYDLSGNSAATNGQKQVKFSATIDYDPTYSVVDAAGNIYQGVYEDTPISTVNEWFLASDGEFYEAETNPRTIKPLDVYMIPVVTNGEVDARILIEEADGSTTEITSVNADKVNNAEGWYTVGGVKLNAEPTEKGVYINNGKKVVIK